MEHRPQPHPLAGEWRSHQSSQEVGRGWSGRGGKGVHQQVLPVAARPEAAWGGGSHAGQARALLGLRSFRLPFPAAGLRLGAPSSPSTGEAAPRARPSAEPAPPSLPVSLTAGPQQPRFLLGEGDLAGSSPSPAQPTPLQAARPAHCLASSWQAVTSGGSCSVGQQWDSQGWGGGLAGSRSAPGESAEKATVQVRPEGLGGGTRGSVGCAGSPQPLLVGRGTCLHLARRQWDKAGRVSAEPCLGHPVFLGTRPAGASPYSGHGLCGPW